MSLNQGSTVQSYSLKAKEMSKFYFHLIFSTEYFAFGWKTEKGLLTLKNLRTKIINMNNNSFFLFKCKKSVFYMRILTDDFFEERNEITPQIHIKKFEEQMA